MHEVPCFSSRGPAHPQSYWRMGAQDVTRPGSQRAGKRETAERHPVQRVTRDAGKNDAGMNEGLAPPAGVVEARSYKPERWILSYTIHATIHSD